MTLPSADQNYALQYAKLNQETAPLPWTELLRHFASGSVIVVSEGTDLIEVGARMACDHTQQVEQWLTAGSIARATDAQAQAWLEENATLWACVVKPWVLVQVHRPREPRSVH